MDSQISIIFSMEILPYSYMYNLARELIKLCNMYTLSCRCRDISPNGMEGEEGEEEVGITLLAVAIRFTAAAALNGDA